MAQKTKVWYRVLTNLVASVGIGLGADEYSIVLVPAKLRSGSATWTHLTKLSIFLRAIPA